MDRIIKVIINVTKRINTTASSSLFSVHSEYDDNLGVHFNLGDTFRVLEEDRNSILIEIINDSNNPYFVDKNILLDISNYGDI